MNKLALFAIVATAGLACAPADAALIYTISADYNYPGGADYLKVHVVSTLQFDAHGNLVGDGPDVNFVGNVTSVLVNGVEEVADVSQTGADLYFGLSAGGRYLSFTYGVNRSPYLSMSNGITFPSLDPGDLAKNDLYASVRNLGGEFEFGQSPRDFLTNFHISVTGTVPPIINAEAPEPASWIMMLSGFGLIGAAMRGRRTVGFAAR